MSGFHGRDLAIADLSVVIPTYNEKDNIDSLTYQLFHILKDQNISSELIIVDDDSPDGTAQEAQRLAKNLPICVIIRVHKKGLGSAILDGIKAAQSQIICVMDADLSHPVNAVPEMYKLIKENQAQLVIGSRKVSGGGTSEWIWYRKVIHWVARSIGSFLTPVQDLTSGFFMFDKKIVEQVPLKSTSWKIGLEIMVKAKYDKVIEYPIVFMEREAGKSKMSAKEVFKYLWHVVCLSWWRIRNCRAH